MSRMTKKKKIALGTAALLCTGGVATAYWTAGGTGTGTAPTDTAITALTANQTTVLAEMYPGDSPQTLNGTFDNLNPGPVYVTSVTVSIASVVKAGGAPSGTCDATDYTVVGATMSVGTEVAPGNPSGSWGGATIQFNNKSTNQDACKGATVNLAYTIV